MLIGESKLAIGKLTIGHQCLISHYAQIARSAHMYMYFYFSTTQ